MSYTTNSTALAAMMLLMVGPAGAQTGAPQSADTIGIAPPRPAPVPGATPVPTPDAPRVALPTQRLAPRPKRYSRPEPSATPTAKPIDTTGPQADAQPVETVPATTPEAPESAPAPQVASPVSDKPIPPSTPVVAPPPPLDASRPLWPWLAGLAVAVAAIAFALLRRRRPAPLAIAHEPKAEIVVPEPAPVARAPEPAPVARAPEPAPVAQAPEPAPVARAPEPAPVARAKAPPSPAPQMLDRVRATTAPAPSAGLTIDLRPIRAGLNLLSATADCEVTVTNTGDMAAQDIRCDLRLLSAHAGQDDDLAAVFAAPGGRPIASAFTLQPGEARAIRGMAVLPRDAIRALNAGGRMMFVPLVAVNLSYRSGGQPRQTIQAFALGIERIDSAKLAPFWLDGPARMHDAVAARPHAPAQR